MPKSHKKEDYLSFVIPIAKDVGALVRAAFNTPKKVDYKSNKNDLVTETDKLVEKVIFSKLRDLFPSHKFIGEESATGDVELGDEPTWIVDPIDGTTNFVYRIPYCAVSIALYEGKKPLVAVLYNPITESLYTAVAGQGAFLNGQRIRVSEATDLETSILVSQAGEFPGIPQKYQVPYAFLDTFGTRGTRALGSAALELAEIARGAADVFLLNGLFCWDVAASVLLIREAGGFICDMHGNGLDNPDDYDILSKQCIAGASKTIVEDLLGRFQQFKAKSN